MAGLKKYSQAIAKTICTKVEEGISVAALCKNSDYFPDEATIYRWKKQYPEFKQALNDAYQIFFYKKIDEIEELSKELLNVDKDLKELNGLDAQEVKGWQAARRAHQDAIRMRLDTLKFILAKLAPKLVNDLKDQPVNQALTVMPNIVIMNYSKPEDEKNITPSSTPRLPE
jgi:hypothetical protein